jgi:hypothetical protein
MQREASFSYFQYNPLQIFYGSKTPVALYARQKWLHQEENSTWRNDFRKAVNDLFSKQCANGSWHNSLLHTIHKLFGLHLTVKNRDERIEKGLEWLLSQEDFLEDIKIFSAQSVKVFVSNLYSLPFSGGCFYHFVKGAVLFLATIFGQENDSRVMRVYEMLRIMGEKRKGRWCTWSCSNNILRSFVVHPEYSESRVVRMYVTRLAEIQRPDGGWFRQIPFYQTVNALAHLNCLQSDAMLKRTFLSLREKQNKDGTWGRTQKEWNTFLIFHAMKRKSHLLSVEKIQGSP